MADVTKIKLPNGSEYDIKDSVSGYITAQTTLAGYGITDAKIENGSIILGSNSITPLTSFTETDPVFSASAAYGINSTDITNWDKIYGLFTVTSGNSDGDYWWVLKIPQSGLYRYTNAPGSSGGLKEIYLPHSGSSRNTIIVNAAYTSSSNTLTLPNKTGTFALTSDIPTIPTNISAFTNDAGYITSYTETDPVFSASAAAGITSSDITNWNNKVSDDHNWGGVSLGSGRKDSTSDQWIPCKDDTNNTSGTAYWIKTTQELPTSSSVEFIQIPRYKKIDNQWYLQSTTPTSTDNSIKVATTAFVQTVLGGYIASDTTANFTISDTAPSNPQAGDLWLDTNSQSASGIAYLPLSAGENHPLSGNLYIDIESGSEYKIVFDENGTEIGKIGMSSDGTMRFWRLDSGNASCGIQCNTNTLNLFASGSGYIVLRPNGINNSATEVTIDSSGWMNGKGFHADAISSDQVNRIGDIFIYRKSNIAGGAMTAGTLKTVDTISQSAYRPNADVDTGFAIGYNQNSFIPLRYGYVRIKSDGSVQISPNADIQSSCYWTIIAIWRNPNFA